MHASRKNLVFYKDCFVTFIESQMIAQKRMF